MHNREDLRKKLTKSSNNRVIAGVLGGLAEYFHINANTLRIIYLIVAALTSFVPGIIIYIMLAVLMPNDPKADTPWTNIGNLFNHDSADQTDSTSRKELHDVEEKDVKK